MPTDAKRQAVAELAELIRSSSAMAVADYRGLKVSEMQTVRRSLRAGGVQLHVAKNRLLKIAADEAQRPDLKPMLDGPTALATVTGDEVAMAKALQDALRPFSRVVTVRGGMLGDRALDAAQLQRLATLPGREVLLGQLAGGMAAPLAGAALVLFSLYLAVRKQGDAAKALEDLRGAQAAAMQTAIGYRLSAITH